MGNLGMEPGMKIGKKCIELSLEDIYDILAQRIIEDGDGVLEIKMQIERKLTRDEWVYEVVGAKVYIV